MSGAGRPDPSAAGGLPAGQLVLVLGGARSGKSRFAEELARRAGGEAVLFVATGRASDPEMAERIRRHRHQRPPAWRTLELGDGPAAQQLEAAWGPERVVLLDCVTLLVGRRVPTLEGSETTNPALAERLERRLEEELQELVGLIRARRARAILVSNEVGWAVVPPYPSGRLFQDLLGWANQYLAARADEVWLMVAGLPLRLKPGLAAGPGELPPGSPAAGGA